MDLKDDVMMIDGLGEGRDDDSWMRADRDQAQGHSFSLNRFEIANEKNKVQDSVQ